MEELNGIVKLNVENVEQVNNLVLQVCIVVVEGGDMIKQVVDIMLVINVLVQCILDIIGVIDGIVF